MEIRVPVSLPGPLLFPPPSISSSSHSRTLSLSIKSGCSLASRRATTPTNPLPGVAFPFRRTDTRRSLRAHGLTGARMSVELEPSLAVKKKATEISDELKGTSIFLVGMNCTMKTNLGKVLADALRYYYFDSDGLIEQAAAGASAAQSFRKRDEKGFRESETEVLRQLSSMGRLVVCTGDGAVQTSTNLAFLRHGISIWVDVPLDLLAKEVLKTNDPSLIPQATSNSDSSSQVLKELSRQYNEMKGGYGTADAILSVQSVAFQLGYEDIDLVTPQDMAFEALNQIEKLTRVKKMMEAAARPF